MTKVELLAGNAILFQKDSMRIIYVPGSDLTNAPEKVKAMASIFWTQEVIQNHLNTENNDATSHDTN